MSTVGDILENAQTPTGSSIDVTDPVDHGQLIVGFMAFFGLAGISLTLYNKLKSETGVDDLQSAVPEL